MHGIAHGGCTDTVRESALSKLTLGENPSPHRGNRTCVGGVPVWCSYQLSYIATRWATSPTESLVSSACALPVTIKKHYSLASDAYCTNMRYLIGCSQQTRRKIQDQMSWENKVDEVGLNELSDRVVAVQSLGADAQWYRCPGWYDGSGHGQWWCWKASAIFFFKRRIEFFFFFKHPMELISQAIV